MRNNTASKSNSKLFAKNVIFECKKCEKEFTPTLKISVGDTNKVEERVKVKYFDAVDLRAMLEDYLNVDLAYKLKFFLFQVWHYCFYLYKNYLYS